MAWGGVQGKTAVEVSLAQGRADASTSASLGDDAVANSGRNLPQIRQRKWCGQYAISSNAFDEDTVGSKSLNTLKLRVSCLILTLETGSMYLRKYTKPDMV